MNSVKTEDPAITAGFSEPRKSRIRGGDIRGDCGGVTLLEVIVATAVIGITIIAMMSGISYMRVQNRAASERTLAANTAAQILEMYKSLPATYLTVSGSNTIYLQGMGTSAPDANWQVPTELSATGSVITSNTEALNIEDVGVGSGAYPSAIPNKLPNGYWQVQFAPLSNLPGVTQITVTVGWSVYPGSTLPPYTYSISTMVNSTFPSI